ncbi:dolichyl-phosphate beta-glucosyltransferase [Terrimicrobium sacchariphilum]|uniref:dolichyl-phosphate beta-glucosyltransferase n=1 Tax=Terrimicrobium sacchariphilum TaxID=690879 RepID=A0A146G6G4_TERSA|nr:dolichyl-phosphate beta-glucosyltransferase [Terrimicrobium sacchariphilum]GAT33170.1 dolichyl-phosphate beta-glucosyltransferase [Terrimicrobium sacchariphilum]
MTVQAQRVSIVIPCRNEESRLPRTLAALGQFIARVSYPVEVLIVVEPGQDGTADLARWMEEQNPAFRAVIQPVQRGKGFAVKTGMLAASGDIVFFMDADLSVPLRCVEEFLPCFNQADVVFGSRRHPQSVIGQSQPFFRVASGRAFNLALRICGVTRFRDTQCGFKAFRAEAAQAVFSRLTVDGFGFDVEALAWADGLGYRLLERPVEWNDAPGTKVRALSDGSRAFFEAVLAARRARAENI